MPLAIIIGAAVLYLGAYHTYGRWLGQKVFRLSAKAVVPSIELEDGQDYVPTSKGVVFGHHFTSIAGTGPIVGPALAVIWGWLPALLWVLFGSILIGAVHDFAALVVSLRNKGQTVGDIAGRVISPTARIIFLLILFVALTIVLAIFGLVIAAVFRLFPEAILPCLLQIPLAVGIGISLHRRGASLLLPSLIALALMGLSVAYSNVGILGHLNAYLAGQSNLWWVLVLLLYSAVASVMPVWLLLQPRDYINSLQLLTTLGLMLLGIIVLTLTGGGDGRPLELVAPTVEPDLSAKQLPMMIPFLFVTIACGAVSGFHCLVSSGTSSKQLRCEPDARFVGFGSMLTEGFLAIVVIMACVAGLGLGAPQMIAGKATDTLLYGTEIFENRYSSWAGTSGLAAKVGAFVDGSANFLVGLGISTAFAKALMGVFVASFAATTLDTACRLQRYVVQELGSQMATRPRLRRPASLLQNRYGATAMLVAVALAMAALPAKPAAPVGTGGMILWPLFGATNQLLGGLAFVVVYFWMREKRLPVWFIVPPMFFMLILPAWALVYQVFIAALGADTGWWQQGNVLLCGVALGTVLLEIWLIAEALKARKRLTF